jgi:hypoxanthine phosphoribosyltransferase
MAKEQQFVTWRDVDAFIDNVITFYPGKGITGVYGIPRGGIILASILSYRMEVPMLMAPHKGCIIIDDIADSGETLLHYDKNTSGGGEDKGYHIVTMFFRPGSLVKPEYHMYLKTDKWIVYPWEKKH